MTKEEFEHVLDKCCKALTRESKKESFLSALQFESRVREELNELTQDDKSLEMDFHPHPQAFPDIAMGDFGVEVKFTKNDTWRSIANSIEETQRIETVKHVYIVFGKMGGTPEVRWGDYEQSVIHVRTSHVPRFEIELPSESSEVKTSLFKQMGIRYDDFRKLTMKDKMKYIRAYARKLHPDGRLWWVEDKDDDDAALYLLTYHGVLCYQARDLFSAGSVANPQNDDEGGIYIARSLKLLEEEMKRAAKYMDDGLFVEYWGESVVPDQRIKRWLEKADKLAKGWKPSEFLFQ